VTRESEAKCLAGKASKSNSHQFTGKKLDGPALRWVNVKIHQITEKRRLCITGDKILN